MVVNASTTLFRRVVPPFSLPSPVIFVSVLELNFHTLVFLVTVARSLFHCNSFTVSFSIIFTNHIFHAIPLDLIWLKLKILLFTTRSLSTSSETFGSFTWNYMSARTQKWNRPTKRLNSALIRFAFEQCRCCHVFFFHRYFVYF